MKWFASRLKEGTTWAGLMAALPSIAALAVDHNNPAAWAAAVGGIASAVIPEKKGQ